MLARSFHPLLSADKASPPLVMILGSSPGVVSLTQQRYYAHPRNAFWWIMSQLLCFDAQLGYHSRVEKLTASGVLLWDVLQQCEREGSLDANISRQSEQVNDLEGMLNQFKTISMICFNGKTAHTVFKRHFPATAFQHLSHHVLPSTSPAHASMSREEKLRHWQVVLAPLECTQHD